MNDQNEKRQNKAKEVALLSATPVKRIYSNAETTSDLCRNGGFSDHLEQKKKKARGKEFYRH